MDNELRSISDLSPQCHAERARPGSVFGLSCLRVPDLCYVCRGPACIYTDVCPACRVVPDPACWTRIVVGLPILLAFAQLGGATRALQIAHLEIG